MTRLNIPIIGFVCLLSCDSPAGKSPDHIINMELPEDSFTGIRKHNIDSSSKHKPNIDISDIESAFHILIKEKVIDNKTNINNTSHPAFCYLSPSAMLDNFIKNNGADWPPDSLKVLTYQDKAFLLEQNRLRTLKKFTWELVTERIDTLNRFPQYRISIPIFSLDKKKFIICIEKYNSANCMPEGISYLFITNGGAVRRVLFDKVNGC